MSRIEFKGWPKIPRMFRDMTITEKIDGTNAAINIVPMELMDRVGMPGRYQLFEADNANAVAVTGDWVVFAQSRNRLINASMDNHGFAKWVHLHAEELIEVLGEGIHYGEWWGSGIQRNYGLKNPEKRFSLFNVKRYAYLDDDAFTNVKDATGLDLVPILYEGPFNTEEVKNALAELVVYGSTAAPGFMNPEGVVVLHDASRNVFKATIKNDEKPKGLIVSKPKGKVTDVQRS
jgi:hypothetical protein